MAREDGGRSVLVAIITVIGTIVAAVITGVFTMGGGGDPAPSPAPIETVTVEPAVDRESDTPKPTDTSVAPEPDSAITVTVHSSLYSDATTEQVFVDIDGVVDSFILSFSQYSGSAAFSQLEAGTHLVQVRIDLYDAGGTLAWTGNGSWSITEITEDSDFTVDADKSGVLYLRNGVAS